MRESSLIYPYLRLTQPLRQAKRRLRGHRLPPPAPPVDGPVLVIAAHPDDEVIGCGGTLACHARRGDRLTGVYLSHGEDLGAPAGWSRETRSQRRMSEGIAAARGLGLGVWHFFAAPDRAVAEHVDSLAPRLAAVLRDCDPAGIYLPHRRDADPDHQAVATILERACREWQPSQPVRVAQYEVWAPLAANFYVDITDSIATKLRAMRRHKLANWGSDYQHMILGLAAYRACLHGLASLREGMSPGGRFSEAFAVEPLESFLAAAAAPAPRVGRGQHG